MKPASEKPWYLLAIKSFLLDDCPHRLGVSPDEFSRDYSVLEERLATEGESFLTKTLPAFGKSIDRALQGHERLVTRSFKKIGRTSRPAFLQALTSRVFKDDGWVADSPDISAIRLLRQICYWCKKIEKGYSDESLQKEISAFKDVDIALPSVDHVFTDGRLGIAQFIIERMFHNIVRIERHAPTHGPGAVAGGESGDDKRACKHSFRHLESVFRPIPWFYSWRDAAESPQRVTDRIKCDYGLSRTEFVEKDSGGPRTIGLEPAEYMWCQQSVKDWMYTHLEKRAFSRGQVNFTDQSINRELARNWSDWETLDMSKASDRNSYALVRTLFQRTRLWPFLRASRTPGTVLPNGDILFYKKFAPMGSAVCFPVQACVYYALACTALHKAGMPLMLTFSRVFVYGDDLIVPRGFFPQIQELFESVGLKFNPDKCCTHGKFRESCGLDAFDGEDVSPVRLKKVYETRERTILPSVVEHANSLYRRGYWGAALAFRKCALTQFRELRMMRVPWTVEQGLPILAWENPFQDTVPRFHKNHIRHIKGWVFEPTKVRCKAAHEVHYLRESLSHGGPVGTFVRFPGGFVRCLSKRYTGRLRFRSLPCLPSCGPA